MNVPVRVAVCLCVVLHGGGIEAKAQADAAGHPYKVIKSDRVGGVGGWDYVYADVDARRLYVPRGDRITVFDLDSLDSVATIPDAHSVHGVAVDPVSHHAFSSSVPVLMWDSRTLSPIRTIEAQGGPDGILFEPATERIYILSHRAPNITAIDARNGEIVGTVDVGGAPEQAVSDGQGHVYVDVEDKDCVAVIEASSLRLTASFSLGGKGGGPAGLALDAKNHVLFAFCRNPHTAVILDARDGHIISTLPIGNGVDGAEFNSATCEAYSSQGDGTMTVIKERSPTDFSVEQTVITRPGARTSTLDTKTNRVILVTADRITIPTSTPVVAANNATPAWRRDRMQMVPDTFTILVVGR